MPDTTAWVNGKNSGLPYSYSTRYLCQEASVPCSDGGTAWQSITKVPEDLQHSPKEGGLGTTLLNWSAGPLLPGPRLLWELRPLPPGKKTTQHLRVRHLDPQLKDFRYRYFLCLSFLSCIKGLTAIPVSQGYSEDETAPCVSTLAQRPAHGRPSVITLMSTVTICLLSWESSQRRCGQQWLRATLPVGA